MGKLGKYKEWAYQRVGAQLARKLLGRYLPGLQKVCLKALFIIFICKVEKCVCVNITDTNLEGLEEGEELKRILMNWRNYLEMRCNPIRRRFYS